MENGKREEQGLGETESKAEERSQRAVEMDVSLSWSQTGNCPVAEEKEEIHLGWRWLPVEAFSSERSHLRQVKPCWM